MFKKILAAKGKRPITALTCYDYTCAKVMQEVDIDVILVGDSLGMVMLGYENTHFVTMDDMIRSTQAVLRANSKALVVADMPIGTCDEPQEAVRYARRLVQETGVAAVKIEGKPQVVKAVVDAGLPVMGHTGLKPQEVERFSVHGRDSEAQLIVEEAVALEKAGCFCIILECIPAELAATITETLKIPTLGIGAGPRCDGQILVMHDVLGLYNDFRPKFVRHYGRVRQEMIKALSAYAAEVRQGTFPGKKESY